MKRVFLILITPILVTLLSFGLLQNFLLPQVEEFVVKKIRSYSEKSLPVNILIKEFHIRAIPLALVATDVAVVPKGDLEKIVQNAKIELVEAQFDYLGLLSGQLRLKAIVLHHWQLHLQIDHLLKLDSKKSGPLPMQKFFEVLREVPIQQVKLDDGDISVNSEKWTSQLLSSHTSFVIEKGKGNLAMQVQSPEMKYIFAGRDSLPGSLDLLAKMDTQKLVVSRMKLGFAEGFLQGKGQVVNLAEALLKPQGVLNVEAFVPVGNLNLKLPLLWKKTKMPPLEGELRLSAQGSLSTDNLVVGHVNCDTKNLKVNKISIGSAAVQGEVKNNEAIFSEVLLEHPAGSARLAQTKIKFNSGLNFSTTVTSDQIDLQKLFLSLNLDRIPVDLVIGGKLACEGNLLDHPELKCEGGITGRDLSVRSEKGPAATMIVKMNDLAAEGRVHVTTQSVTYDAKVRIKNSRGSSQGEIDYDQGFKIKYFTDNLNFDDIDNLINLKFRGQLSLEGSTSGNSNQGQFSMKVKSKDFGIEAFELGSLNSDLSYASGHIKFENIQATLGQSQYNGHVDLDLHQSHISGEMRMPTVHLGDLAFATDKLLHVPVETSGEGTGKLEFSGPLDFWKLNYQWRSEFSHCTIAREKFENLKVEINGNQGNMEMSNVTLMRGGTLLNVTGKIGNDKEMDLSITGSGWKLEDTNYINKISPNILGNLHWAAVVQGPIAEPFFQIKGKISDTIIEDQELADSTLELQATREMFWGKLSLFDKRVDAVFSIPLESSASELALKARIDNFGYTQLLALFGAGNLINDYDSNLTGTIDLRSHTGNVEDFSGEINIERLYLRRRNLFVGNIRPIVVSFFEGKIRVKDFLLDGNGSSLSLASLPTKGIKENKFKFNAETDARLWHLFVPFFDDFGGKIHISTEVTLAPEGVQVLGLANLNQVFLKIKGIPHPFEKIQGEIGFSHRKASLNSLKGTFAGGKLDAEGFVQFDGLKLIPVQIRFGLNEVHLNLPDKVRTYGSGDFVISGNWFPYTLSGNYHIQSGLMEKEFADDSGATQVVRRSVYLPKLVQESQFEPLKLDLFLNFEKGVAIKNSILDGEITGKLQVKGPPGNPTMLGHSQLTKKSKLLFKDKIFEIQTALIDFEASGEINPDLYITAQSRVQDYDLTLLVQGPAKNHQFKLSSIPPLSDKDIISLLALGMTSSDLDQKGQSGAQAQQTGVEVTNQLLKSIKLDRKVKDATGWTLQVTSQVDSTKSVTVPKAIATKKMAEKVNATIAVGADQSREMKLQYLINSNLSAVGSYEERVFREGTTGAKSFDAQSRGYLGIDLEFKREFK